MAKFEFIESESDDYFELNVEVSFDKSLMATDITRVLTILLDVVTNRIAIKLIDGISSLKIDNKTLDIKFSFSKKEKDVQALSDEDEDISRLRAQLVFHIFAKIDSEYRLSDTAFPPDFRGFLDWSSYIDI